VELKLDDYLHKNSFISCKLFSTKWIVVAKIYGAVSSPYIAVSEGMNLENIKINPIHFELGSLNLH